MGTILMRFRKRDPPYEIPQAGSGSSYNLYYEWADLAMIQASSLHCLFFAQLKQEAWLTRLKAAESTDKSMRAARKDILIKLIINT